MAFFNQSDMILPSTRSGFKMKKSPFLVYSYSGQEIILFYLAEDVRLMMSLMSLRIIIINQEKNHAVAIYSYRFIAMQLSK